MSLTYVNKPNFFILGAGKSGTTTLYYHLKEHPEIFLPSVKEPSFFSEGFQVINNPVKYFELFDSVSTESAIGEASHVYMSNPTTAKVLKALFPEAKFIVILRNPADRAYSLYHHMRRHGYEHINTFEAAIDAEEQRHTSRKFIENCPQYFYNYLYFRSGLYGAQLQNYFSIFPRQQFHIMKFENFITDPVSHFKNIFQFLGVNTDYAPGLELHNDGKLTARFAEIQYYVNIKMANHGMLKKLLVPILNKLNVITTPLLQNSTRELLLARYAVDLQLLRDTTGISFID